MTHIVAPSILACDFSNLSSEIKLLNESACDWIHVDIMDGNFVPNISFGIPICLAVKNVAEKPLDVHLMIEQPERYIFAFRDAGADRIIVHYEACVHLHRVLQQIRDTGAHVGIAINPHTPVTVLRDVLGMIDQVTIMSVNPGFGGQQFIPNSLAKVSRLKEMLTDSKREILIEMDGGVTLKNAKNLLDAGVDVIVSGNSVFKSKDPKNTIQLLKNVSET